MNILLTLLSLVLLGLANVSYAADSTPKPYALTTCFVSGETIGEMGKPVIFIYKGQEIKMCCKDCKKKFDQDPAKYMQMYQEAVKKAAASLG